ncbi:alpha/beta hydrolase [Duganella sp. SAP-35]|uniref:Alpha/beta hydrolase n=2 Tax=Duganella aceris TaxID=2703883 RepID=A0ABX0FPH9_9BURK|nr:alpha/beta hydrolase [Duganella aceris]
MGAMTVMRGALIGGVFGAAALLAPSIASAQVQAPQAVKTVVLVHGAWADGSSWNKVIPLLEATGLRVVSVQHPLTSIADDVAATNRLIDAQEGPVLLVGHSYGGVVITEAGVHPKVAGLVYVAAFAPDAGETVGAVSAPYGNTPAIAEICPLKDGFLVLSPKGVAEDFAQDLPAAEQRLLAATQGPVQGAVLGTPLKAAAWRVKPSWAVIAANDRTIAPQQEIDGARRMGARTLTLSSSHVAMLAKPKEVAAFIAEAAAGK